jgi:hypothetical protein
LPVLSRILDNLDLFAAIRAIAEVRVVEALNVSAAKRSSAATSDVARQRLGHENIFLANPTSTLGRSNRGLRACNQTSVLKYERVTDALRQGD